MTQQKNPPRDDLTHYGVKGMHWGVRKARTGFLDKHATKLERSVKPGAKLRDKTYALANTPIRGMVKNGVKKAASTEAAKSRAEIQRLAKGKETTLDILKAYGSTTITGLVKAMHTKSDFSLPQKG